MFTLKNLINNNYQYDDDIIKMYLNNGYYDVNSFCNLNNCKQNDFKLLDGPPFISGSNPETANLHMGHCLISYLKSAFDIYGAFINKKGVCEAYSKAFQTLCYAVGINANQAVGVGHMWNTVKLDGDWYYVDVTWDDPIVNGGTIDIISYDYFNKTTAQMHVAHSLDPNSYLKVPVCKGTKYAYNG